MEIPRASESEFLSYDVIPTGLPQLDRALGIRGIPTKRITEISGSWSVGKTTLALSIVAEAQKKDMGVIWMDAEWSWDDSYAKKLGVDTAKMGLLQHRYAESALDQLLEYVEKGKNSLLVIDSVGGLHPKDEAEKDSGERTIGAQAGLVARFCRKIVPMLAINNNALLVINHEYVPIMSMGGRPTVKTSGGAKLEYHKSIWIRLQRAGKNLNQGEDRIGFVVNAEIRKNKMADTMNDVAELELYYGLGFSPTSDLFAMALDKGIIEKRGNRYFFGENVLGTGVTKAKEGMKQYVQEITAAMV